MSVAEDGTAELERQRPLRVLVADDDESMRDLLEAVLRARGHEVMSAENGEEALETFRREQPDLVILDWEMPKMDGREVCRAIRGSDNGRATFVLVFTARDGEDDLVTMLDAGADDYIAKPVAGEHLLARLTITERRIQLEGARRAAEDALARAQWLAGIGQTTLTLQHEINNPLAALVGHASLLSLGDPTAEQQAEHISVILDQARRIASVVQRLSRLKDPKAVEYLEGVKMLDLPE